MRSFPGIRFEPSKYSFRSSITALTTPEASVRPRSTVVLLDLDDPAAEPVPLLVDVKADGTALRRHTDPDEYYARSLATDGRKLVYQCAGELYLLRPEDDDPRRIEFRLDSSRTQRARSPNCTCTSSPSSVMTCRSSAIRAVACSWKMPTLR